jgi:3-methylfumaryl-CoA hydratase
MSAAEAQDAPLHVRREELVLPGPALALADVLGTTPPPLQTGAPLPLLWHWVYLLDRPAQRDLGSDGHPVRASLPLPPFDGARRMFAGGRVSAVGPLRCGERATRTTRLLSSRTTQGRSGELTFVTVESTIVQRQALVLREEQDIVYRAAHRRGGAQEAPGDGLPVVPVSPDERAVEVTPTLLFRFSALTYNAHRIHYDRQFAQSEGYPGLLTHGPLQAVLMVEAWRAREEPAARAEFTYRLVAPLFEHQGLVVGSRATAEGTETWVRDVGGRRTAEGRVTSS